MDSNTKKILLALFAFFLIFELGTLILYSIKYQELPKQYTEAFQDWQGWLVLGLAVAASIGMWYGIDMIKI